MSIVAEVRSLIEDTGVLYTDQHVYDALNASTMRYWGRFEHAIETATATVTANQEIMKLPENIMIPYRVRNNDSELYSATISDLERWKEGWRSTVPAKPVYFVLWDATALGMFPRPNETYAFIVEGPGYPPVKFGEVIGTSTTTDIQTLDSLREAIVYDASANLVLMMRPDLAQVWFAEAQEAEYEVARELRIQFKHKYTGLRPATTETIRNLGEPNSTRSPAFYL